MNKIASISTETASSQQDAPLCEQAERATPGWSADAPNQASSSPYFNLQSVQLSQESQGVDLRPPISHQAPQAEALPQMRGIMLLQGSKARAAVSVKR